MAFPVLREILALNIATTKGVFAKLPFHALQLLLREPKFVGLSPFRSLQKLTGKTTLGVIEELGPVYGKIAQIGLSRLPEELNQTADFMELTRLYGDWDPIDIAEIKKVLDRNFDNWRDNFKLNPKPLGVASIAQVHAITDFSGREWIVKIVKPHAKKRMRETTAALNTLVKTVRAARLPSQIMDRFLDDVDEMIEALRSEIDLNLEKKNILAISEKLKGRKKTVLRIPTVFPEFCTREVLVMERFRGTPLSDITSGKSELTPEIKRRLAQRALHEMLVQVFELGLFHADPHAGNLMYLDDGSIGLFDWGLAGQLTEADRETIASLLKAVMHRDIVKLEAALGAMSEREGKKVSPKKMQKELDSLKTWFIKQKEQNKKPSLAELFSKALKTAERLKLAIPGGLLMMVKSLVTIEGLGKGLDPEVSIAKVAMPVLLRAARPSLGDFVKMGLNWTPIGKISPKK